MRHVGDSHTHIRVAPGVLRSTVLLRNQYEDCFGKLCFTDGILNYIPINWPAQLGMRRRTPSVSGGRAWLVFWAWMTAPRPPWPFLCSALDDWDFEFL